MSNASDFVIENGVLKKYVGPGGDVVIPEGVTDIDGFAFAMCENLTSVVIPEGVISIGDFAFSCCKNLASIVVPKSVTSIGDMAFDGCDKLCSADDFRITNGILLRYKGLAKNVMIPEGVTGISSYAFEDCGNLESVIIPEGVVKIGDSAFKSCWNLKSIVIPKTVTRIGYFAFSGCNNLQKITAPACMDPVSVSLVGDNADLRIDIPDISHFPLKYRRYAALCFAEDGGLNTDPRFESHSKYLKDYSGKLVEIAVENLPLLTLLCREGWIKAKDIECYVEAVQKTNDAERIAMILDYQNNKLTKKQKESVVKQKERQENKVFDRALARRNQVGIAGLNFVVTGDLTTFKNRTELKNCIEQQGGKLQTALSTKTDYLITNNLDAQTEKNRKAAELGVAIITEAQFNDKAGRSLVIDGQGKLTRFIGYGGDVVIPEGVTSIGDNVFLRCTGLNNIIIPESVISIGYYAFGSCENLESVVIPKSVISIGRSAFSGCKKLGDADGFFAAGGTLFVYSGSGGDIVIPEGVTSIADWTFGGCESLTSVIIPKTMNTIGDFAFSGCNNLTSILIPDSVTEIGFCAFSGCENLTSIVIPDSVTYIDEYTFSDCKNLASITLSAHVTKISEDAFKNCEVLTFHAPAGSYAETYAKENNIPFVAE